MKAVWAIVVLVAVIAVGYTKADQDFYCGDVEVTIMYRTIDLYNKSDKYSWVVAVISPNNEFVKVCLPPLTSCGTYINDVGSFVIHRAKSAGCTLASTNDWPVTVSHALSTGYSHKTHSLSHMLPSALTTLLPFPLGGTCPTRDTAPLLSKTAHEVPSFPTKAAVGLSHAPTYLTISARFPIPYIDSTISTTESVPQSRDCPLSSPDDDGDVALVLVVVAVVVDNDGGKTESALLDRLRPDDEDVVHAFVVV
ncbi:hypothetical protein Pelo_4210 [Pelomyxa schiedti]|nr:hypothetical protein Pelo_4210 [Pelomyxa schiedti]